MIQSEHVTREELQELLNCDLETDRTRGWQSHLQSCETCRKALDQMAARSEIWQKTPQLLRGKSDSGQYIDLGSGELETQDLAVGGRGEAAESEQADEQMAFGYPVDALLEPPRHPEMMGRIGRYDIEREIGRGGMGIVFKAHDSELNRPLAVKILAPHLANHGPARQRFAQEARAAAGVLHPNVIAVHDVNNEGKTPYIVMPYIAGSSLQTLVVQNGPLAEIEIVRLALQIAAGLTPAHAQGLVHRDIKPANILVERGVNRVIITDFGLARAEDDASLTKTGWLTGTPNYMSPEQTRGGRLDHRSDLFSLGSLIYFLATGRLPFRAESPLGVLNRIQNDTPTSVRQVNNHISTTLSQIIEVLLRKEPDHRFQSAGELHDVLEQHLAHLHQPDIAKPPKVIEASSGNWGKSIGISGAIGVLVLGCWFLSVAISNSNEIWSFFEGREPQETVFSIGGENGPNGMPVPISAASTGPLALATGNICEENELPQVTFFTASGPNDDGSDDFNTGYDLLANGKYDEAIPKFKTAANARSYAALATYNIACCYALKDDSDQAFEYLDGAIKHGFFDTEKFRTDDDLKSIRSDGRFPALIARVKNMEAACDLVCKANMGCEDCVCDCEQGDCEQGDCEGCKDCEKCECETKEQLLMQALKLHPENPEAAYHLGYYYHMNGEVDRAMKWHLLAAKSTTRGALGNYNAACVYSLKNDKDLAFKYLEQALESGLAFELEANHLAHDADLDNIRDEKRFADFLTRMQTRIADCEKKE